MKNLARRLLGKPKDPTAKDAGNAMALTILLAWIGLGADGLSSACYGPEQSFLALGKYSPLALWLAIATAVTIFIIAFAYNRVISLFPDGGGGYKVATRLLGQKAGLIAGVALMVDYVLTIVISIASGTEAIFSMLPAHYLFLRLPIEAFFILFLTYLNMRGVKESIKILMPIFLGFVLVHVGLIIYGITSHHMIFPKVIHAAVSDSKLIWGQMGLIFTLAIFLHAYAQGGGTYTGLEAVSNNVNTLAKPRVRTGQWTMFYMALSLSIVAGGIIILYLLWQTTPVAGETLNAVVFAEILGNSAWGHAGLILTMILEAGLLFVAANTGFLGGPAVLANMANDKWVPKQFTSISSRLVKQNGLLLFGLSSVFVLFITAGHIKLLIILYSLSVFLAFTIALSGLCVYYFKHFQLKIQNFLNIGLLLIGTLICTVILVIVVITSFTQGAWLAILLLGLVTYLCWTIKKNYRISSRLLHKLDNDLCAPLQKIESEPLNLDPTQPTAVILVGDSRGAAMHTLLTIKRLFGHHYHNYIFLSVGVVDSFSVAGDNKIHEIEERLESNLQYLAEFCQQHKMPTDTRLEIAVDPVEKISEMAQKIEKQYSNAVFYASQLVFPGDSWIQRIIHNKTALVMQRKLYSFGYNMMILPVKVKL